MLTRVPTLGVVEKLYSNERFAKQEITAWQKENVRFAKMRGRPAFIEEVATLASDWSIFMQMRNPNLHSLIGWNSTCPTWSALSVLIGCYGASLIGQYRCK